MLLSSTSVSISKPQSLKPLPEFKAIILCGYGQQLFPLVENTPKPMIPVGNEPVISYVLKWCEESGVNDVLVLSPSSFSHHLSPFLKSFNSDNLPIPSSSLNSKTKSQQHEDFHIRYETVDDDDCAGWETADWLRKFENLIKTDFIILPCDILPPTSLTLSNVLESHRKCNSNTMVTSLYYEHPTDFGSREGPSRALTIYEPQTSTLIMPSCDIIDAIDLKSRLVWEFPKLKLSTQVSDAHVYVVKRNVLDLLVARPEIASIREDLIPWLCKWCWQKGLWNKWGGALNLESNDYEFALEHSTNQSLDKVPDDNQKVDSKNQYSTSSNAHSNVSPNQRIRVEMLIHKASDGFLVRANTLGGYAEMNREILRIQKPSVTVIGRPPTAPDSLMSTPVKIGEKTLIKKSIIGRNVEIGKGCKIIGCIIADNAVIKDGVKMDNCIVCTRAKIGERSSLTVCDIGGDSDILPDTQAKNEKLSLDE